MVKVRFFASLRDFAGTAEVEVETRGPSTVLDLFETLKLRYPGLQRYESSVLVAVNEEYAQWESPVKTGDEVAFFPPVSGGGR